ncbi:MAG: sulfotransferase family 2 domain-containing protein [Synechococcaceae cyanobacterium]|nr:sulfotransferase family 2 domain-containing protein [Synechococcaceae cyanobacterium]
MPIDRERGLAFVHIPKTAGTAIEQAIGLHGDWRQEDRQRCFGRIRSEDLLAASLSSNFLQHLSIRELQDLLRPELGQGLHHLWWFTVVRHPWTRLLSAFRRKDPDLCQLYAYRCDRDLHSLDLAAFIEVAAWLDHPHLRPQMRFLENAVVPVQRFRYEELARLCGALASHLQRPISLKRVNEPLLPLQEESLPDRDRLLARVAQIYAEDMDGLGYFETA